VRTFVLVVIAVAFLPLVAAYAYAALTFLLFPLLTRKDPDPVPGFPRDRVRAWWLEGVSQAWAFYVSWTHHSRTPRLVCAGIGRPIVLLPGYTETAGALWILGRRLNRLTGRPIFACSHRPSMYSRIEDLAGNAATDIAKACVLTKTDDADVVGHSMGGLVARYCVEKMGLIPLIRKVVALGTPHAGARLARTRLGRCTAQMIPGSAFLAGLSETLKTVPESVRYASIGSLVDNIVQPVESTVSPRGEHIWFGDVAHVGLLLDPSVAREVARLVT